MLGNPLLLGDDGYQISRSVRLRSTASAFFSRTPASAGNRRTWTWSGWVKRGLGSTADDRMLFSGTTNGTSTIGGLFFNGGGESLRYIDITTPSTFQTNVTVAPVYRDFSAWYHIVLAVDTTQATAANRIRFFVNGAEVTTFTSTVYPSQNADTFVNAAQQHRIGTYPYSASGPFDGYLTEVNFIDGQALTPAAFGETDAVTGVWKPRRYTGTYGTNGFFLNFSDPSAATAGAIGADRSGNGNNWTPNNISVTAGVTYDSMLDVPTPWADGGNGRGNYAVWLPIDTALNGSTLTNGNLTLTTANAAFNAGHGSFSVSSGKWYWEITIASLTAGSRIGIDLGWVTASNLIPGNTATSYGFSEGGQKWTNSTSSAYGATYTTNDVLGVILDMDTGTISLAKNGTNQGIAFSGIVGTATPWLGDGSADFGSSLHINFGQRPFAYTPPTGFRALNTQNLPEPLINRGNQWMDATTYTGNGSTQSIVNAGGFQPDLVWVKSRSNAFFHQIYDTIRGAQNALYSNATNAETTEATGLTAFGSSGFTVSSGAGVNQNAATYVGWQWRESAQAGFDIVTYTGTGVNRTVSHSLGVAPSMVIVKARNAAGQNWAVLHQAANNGAGQNGYLLLNSTLQFGASSFTWNNTSPTSSVFSVGTDAGTNGNGTTFVAYCFAEVPGFSRFGSYTGNGSADGPFVFCGFRPRWIMVKATDIAGYSWEIFDVSRNPSNVSANTLHANVPDSEYTTLGQIDILSNGFKPRNTRPEVNNGGSNYIFAAFAENPFKHSLAR
jgi:hypothetical protein